MSGPIEDGFVAGRNECSPGEIEERLRFADAVRGRSPADAQAALRAYLDHQDAIDPSTPAGAARVIAIASDTAPLDPAFEPLLGRAAAWGTDAAVREAAASAASRIALHRGEFDRAEAAIRRSLRTETDALDRAGSLGHLAVNWASQGREHEGLTAARFAHAATAGSPRNRALASSAVVGAVASLGDPALVLAAVAAWRAESQAVPAAPGDAGPPSFRSVAVHEGDARLALGDPAGARAAWAEARAGDAPPSYATILRPALRVREARALLAEGHARESYDAAAPLVREPGVETRTRADAALASLEALAAMGPSPAIAVAAIEWIDLLRDEGRRLGTAVVLRYAARTIGILGGRYVPAGLADEAAAIATSTVPDRVAELVRFAADPDVPADPGCAGVLADFRRSTATRFEPLMRRIATGPAAPRFAVRLASVLGHDLRRCPACLFLVHPAGPPVPAGHLLPAPFVPPPAEPPCPGCA